MVELRSTKISFCRVRHNVFLDTAFSRTFISVGICSQQSCAVRLTGPDALTIMIKMWSASPLHFSRDFLYAASIVLVQVFVKIKLY